jgi:cobalt-zinc-cadmium efflux system outer membrane protein
MDMRLLLRGASLWLVLLHLPSIDAQSTTHHDVAGRQLTLADARALALARSPELASVDSEVRARQAHAVQAGLLPNPELRTDVENVGGSGDRQGFEETETTVRLSQRIELGGKRGQRRRVAELGRALATWDVEARRLAVLAGVTQAFVRTLAAQERLRLAEELERLARRGIAAADVQVKAGGAPPVEAERARVAHARSDVARRRAERELDAARRRLAATWGGTDATFGRLEGDLERLGALPPLDALVARLDDSPDLARWTTELEERSTALALEEAGRIPDVTVGAGGRHFSDNGDTALVFELSVPLPVFDRNQGAVAEAVHRLAKARADRDVAGLGLRTALVSAYAELAASREQAVRLRDDVIPAARRSLDATADGYRKGAARFGDVLDAQRTLFELRGDYLAALETFHLQAADVERLTASPLASGGAP